MGQKIDLTYQVQGVLPPENGGAGTLAGVVFHDNETPSGTVDGVNSTFTLQTSPVPSGSLMFVIGHNWQLQGIDYSLSGATISCTSPPISGANLRAWYRNNQSVLVVKGERLIMADNIAATFFQGQRTSDSANNWLDKINFSLGSSVGWFEDRLIMSDSFSYLVVVPKVPTDTMTMSDNFVKALV